MADSKAEILADAKRRFKHAADSDKKQREREVEDLRFQVPEYQWDPRARALREGQQAEGNMPAVPPRPILSISKLDQPIRLVLNQERSAHLGVNIHPVSEDANKDEAKVRQGLYRAIERDSRAHIARSWAFDRGVKCGTGYWLITTEYDDESGHPFDQKIRIKRIFRQDSVFWDPAATEPDNSDAEWAFIETWMSLDDYERGYPRAKVKFDDDTFKGISSSPEPDWVSLDGEKKGVRVVQYFCKKHVPETITAEDGSGRTREVDHVTCVSYKLNALEVLEEQELNGSRIPIVTYIGRELQPFEKERRREGMIRPARDPQKGFNYSVSQAVTMAALEPQAPFVGAEGQFEGHEEAWQQANSRAFPYLQYKPTALNGTPVPPPQRMQVDMSRLGPSLMLMDKFETAIQATTQTYDPSLGNLSSKERSGKAIQALQGQADAGSSDFIQNLAIAIEYEALVILEWMSAVYDRDGRLAQILDGEDNEETIALNAPYVMDPKTGRPRVLPQAGMDGMQAGLPQNAKHHRMKDGTYGISVKIGKSYQTRQQQGEEELGQLLAADPTLMMSIGDIYMKFRDTPGAEEIASRLKKLIEQLHPGLTQKDDGSMSPEQYKAQLQAIQQENQQLKQMIAKATQAIETDMAKQQATKEKAQADNQTKLELEERGNAHEMALAKFQAAADAALEAMKLKFEAALQAAKQEHELGMGRAAAGVEIEENERARGHASDEAAQERDYQAEQAEQSREFEGSEAEAERASAAEQAEADRQAQADRGEGE